MFNLINFLTVLLKEKKNIFLMRNCCCKYKVFRNLQIAYSS